MNSSLVRFSVSIALALLTTPATEAAFTPLQGDQVILSVDMNGGALIVDPATTLGWNGAVVQPVTPGNVLWTPWGGRGPGYNVANSGGDDIQLPNSAAEISAASISKSFGAIAVTISISGLASNYAQINATASLNSRDRTASAIMADQGNVGTQNQFGRNMYRDFIHAEGSGTNVASTNFMQVAFSGLKPDAPHTIALYNYDRTGAHRMQWTATPPTAELGNIGWFQPGTNNFAQPDDAIEISWVGSAPINSLPGPAVMNLWSDSLGNITLWGYGKGGDPLAPGDNNVPGTTYLNGFQISVPEPTALSLAAVAVASVLGVQRRSQLTAFSPRRRRQAALCAAGSLSCRGERRRSPGLANRQPGSSRAG